MKASLGICAVLFVVLVSAMEGEELPQRETLDAVFQVPAIPERSDRHKRVTCDLLSFQTPWGSLGNAACAAHCLVLNRGYRGGYCDDKGVCNCRK